MRNVVSRFRGAVGRGIVMAMLGLSFAGVAPQPAEAKPPKKQTVEEPPKKDYAVPWALVSLSIGLGLLLVCRPGRRLDAPKISREDLEQKAAGHGK